MEKWQYNGQYEIPEQFTWDGRIMNRKHRGKNSKKRR